MVCKKSLKITKGQSESVNNTTVAKRKRTKVQTTLQFPNEKGQKFKQHTEN